MQSKKKRTPKRASKKFYMVAVDKGEFYETVNDDIFDVPLKSTSIREARTLKNSQYNSEKLSIIRCEVVE